MLGGYRFKELFGEPETVDPEHLKQIALGALKSYLKIQVEPVHHLVSIHQVCCVQSILCSCYQLVFILELHCPIHTQSWTASGNN